MDDLDVSNLRLKQAKFFASGATRTENFRRTQLEVLASAVRAREAEILAALNKDLGKCTFDGMLAEVGFLYEEIAYAKKHLARWMKPKRSRTPLTVAVAKSEIIPEPLGQVLIIGPWNYPFQLLMSPLVGAIAAGNCVVLKPSELAPETSKVTAALIAAVFPEDYIACVCGGVETSQALLRAPWDHIFFTGGTEVGKVVMRAAAEHLSPVTLELGGKSPCLVDETANIGVAAKRIAWGKFVNAGQTCVAPDYILVPPALKQELVTKLGEAIRASFGENPELSPDYGRVVSTKHFQRLEKLLEGGKIAVGGGRTATTRFFAPTILTEVRTDSPVMQDEIFGPILPVLTYEKLSDAIAFIRSRPKPLALYHFSESAANQAEVREKCSFGGGCVNDTLVHLLSPELPFGGVGPSGIGAYHGKHTFDRFSHFKSVVTRATWFDPALRYPPYGDKLKWLRRFLGF